MILRVIILIMWISGISSCCGFNIYSPHQNFMFVEFESLGKDRPVDMADIRV